jgi:phosphate starvation-inducible protein PhoH and related proteins
MARKRTMTSDPIHLPYFKAKTQSQAELLDTYKANDITFILGPAGTGKTHLAVYCAIHDLFYPSEDIEIKRIIITRPIVEAGENLGFLPGEISEKVHPYMIPVYDCIRKMVHKADDFIAQYFDVSPLAYMRGITFQNSVAILDEAQNCTEAQLKLFMSRLGEKGRLIITGDPEQSDIGKKSFLNKLVNAMDGEKGIGVHRFTDTDIVRHPLVGRVLKRWPK